MTLLDEALREIAALEARVRHKRRRPFVSTYLQPGIVERLVADAQTHGNVVFKRARVQIRAAHALAQRDRDLGPIGTRLQQDLHRVLTDLSFGRLPLAAALVPTRAALARAVEQAFTSGAQTLFDTYVPPDEDLATIDQRASEATQHAIPLLTAAAAGTLSPQDVRRRLDLWGQSLRGTYERGKGAGARAANPNAELSPLFTWVAIGDDQECDYCNDMDGAELTADELDTVGWPGEGAFGDTNGCGGGPLCRCEALPRAA